MLAAARDVAAEHDLRLEGRMLIDARGDPWTVGEWMTETLARMGVATFVEEDWVREGGKFTGYQGERAERARGPSGQKAYDRLAEPSADAVTQAAKHSEAVIRQTVSMVIDGDDNIESTIDADGERHFTDAMGNDWSETEIVDMVADQIAGDRSGTVSVLMSEDSLARALEGGRILNQFESKSSAGNYDPEYRRTVEETQFGVARDASPADRPVYGTTQYQEGYEDSAVLAYGDVVVDLKGVDERSTITMGDSFDGLVGLPMTGELDKTADRDRLLAAVSYEYAQTSTQAAMSDIPGLEYMGEEIPEFTQNSYYEVQVHGGVSVDDIAHVYFEHPPEYGDQVTNMLDERGITWSQG